MFLFSVVKGTFYGHICKILTTQNRCFYMIVSTQISNLMRVIILTICNLLILQCSVSDHHMLASLSFLLLVFVREWIWSTITFFLFLFFFCSFWERFFHFLFLLIEIKMRESHIFLAILYFSYNRMHNELVSSYFSDLIFFIHFPV